MVAKKHGLMCPYTHIIGNWSTSNSLLNLSFNRLQGANDKEIHIHYASKLEVMLLPCNFALRDFPHSELKDWIVAIKKLT